MEDAMQIKTGSGKWNDEKADGGKVIEYGASSTTPVRFSGARTIGVQKSVPVITAVPTASAILAGEALSNSTLSGGTASVPGTFGWTTPTTVPSATGSYGVTFMPTDTANYSTVTTEVSVTVNLAAGGPQFASYYNDTYPFSPTAPTLTIMGTNLDQATKGFSLVNSMSAMGSTPLMVTSQMSSQVTLSLPTSMASGTYYVVYDEGGMSEFVLGYLNTSIFGGGTMGGTGGGTGDGTGGGGTWPASVQTAATSTQPSLTASSSSGGIQTMSLSSSSSSMLFSYSRPAGGTYQAGQYVVGGLRYEVQQSSVLGSWTSVDALEVGSVPLDSGWERVTVRVPASGDRSFLRVKVSD
ncbi:MAG: hypothetical protein EBZ53_05430 [Verrucomicrobia bacterium]|nr:hypothetical protein [Verrucomicrobiota bacterium]